MGTVRASFVGVNLAIAALLLAGILYALGRIDAGNERKEEDWRQRSSMALSAGRSYREGLERARLQAVAARATADSARRVLALGDRRRDSLQLLVRRLNLDSVPPAVVNYISVLEGRDSAWAVAYAALTLRASADSTRADLAEARVRVLEPLLVEGVKLKTCRIAGLISCPSRTTTFVIGLATGVVGSIVIK